MKIQSINQTQFKSLYESRGIYYDLPSTYDNLPQGQMKAVQALDRKMSGLGWSDSFCPKTELYSKGWQLYTAPSTNVNVIDVAMINNAKLLEKSEKNIFGTPRVKKDLQYDAAIILGGFYDKDWLTSYDLASLDKLKKTFSMDKLLEKIREGLEFAKSNIEPKQKGIFKL